MLAAWSVRGITTKNRYSFMQRFILSITLFLAILVIPFFVFAHAEESHSADEVLNEILASQGVSRVSQIDCSGVSDDQLDELGDAVMSLMHPDAEEHEVMDEMMGGEGSTSLRSAHILMGKSYIGCAAGMMGGGMMRMMGDSWGMTMGEDASGFPMRMSGWGDSDLGTVTTILIWIVLLLAIIALLKWITARKK